MIASLQHLAVVPILVGPLQVFLAMLPAILFGIGSALLALFKPATFKLALRLLWRVKVSLIIAIALVSGTVFAARAVWRSASPVGQAEAGSHDWPLFRGNARRTGATETGGAPLEGGLNWAFASEAKTFHSSPTVVGNRVYATSAEVGVFSNRGAIYCLDADTGGVVWKSVPEGMRATFSSPSISGKYLVTGEGLHQVRDGRITCLDLTRGGAVLWTFRTKSHVESSAALADGRAIIGAGDDGYYCFRLEPDAKGNPVLQWHLPGDQYPDAETDPIVHEGRAYLGLGINGQAVVCVEAATGKELWRVATPSPVFSPPTIAHDKLFIGMGHGNFVETEEQVIAAELERLRAAGKSATEIESAKTHLQPGGEAWCIDLATHQVEWRFKTDSTVLGAIVAREDRLFIASRAGTVYSLGFDGKPVATWNARAPIIASLTATASHVYAVTESGLLFALQQGSLQPAWETRLGNSGSFLSSPAIARGHVYAGSPEDGLLCVGRPAGQSAMRIWAGELGGAGMGGNPEGVSLPPEGEVLWSSGDSDDEYNPPAAVLGNTVFLPQWLVVRRGLIRFDAEDEALVERWYFPTENPVKTSPGAAGDIVAFSEESGPRKERRLHVLGAANGKERWSVAIEPGEIGEPGAYGLAAVTTDSILVEERRGWLSSYDHSGHLRWRQSYSPASEERLAGVPAIRDSLIVVAGLHCLTVLDELSGAALWTMPQEYLATGPVLHGNSILLPVDDGVSAYRLVDGKVLYHLPSTGDLVSGLVRVGNLMAGTNERGELVIIDPVAGKLIARKPAGADPQYTPLPDPNGLLFDTRDGLSRFQLETGTITPWLSMQKEKGEFINSSLVVVGSSVCFSSNLRFIRAGKRRP
jgi:outer membrane protein assembly factor BamB